MRFNPADCVSRCPKSGDVDVWDPVCVISNEASGLTTRSYINICISKCFVSGQQHLRELVYAGAKADSIWLCLCMHVASATHVVAEFARAGPVLLMLLPDVTASKC